MKMTAYCKMEFLKALTFNLSTELLGIEDLELVRYKLDLVDLIFKGPIVKTDSSYEEIESSSDNPYIKHLIKNLKIKPAEHQFAKLVNNDEQGFIDDIKEKIPFFLFDNFSAKQARRFEDYFGFHCLETNSQYSNLFVEKIKTFNTKSVGGWLFAKDFLRPHNSMVVADPYLFKGKTLDSLIDLLTAAVSKRLKGLYYLTLVGDGSPDNQDEPFTTRQINKFKDKLIEKIPDVNFVIESFFYKGAEFHDRYIITNNTSIFSGYGLDILKSGISHKDGTWIASKPFKRVKNGSNQGIFFYEIMEEKLQVINTWIKKTGWASTNPLLAF